MIWYRPADSNCDWIVLETIASAVGLERLGTLGAIRTHTGPGLNRTPLPLGYEGLPILISLVVVVKYDVLNHRGFEYKNPWAYPNTRIGWC